MLEYFSWIPPGRIQQLEDRTQPPRQQHAHGNSCLLKWIFSCPCSNWTRKLIYFACDYKICNFMPYIGCKYGSKLILSLLQLCLQKALKSEFIFAREQIFPVPVNYWKNIFRWRLPTRSFQSLRQNTPQLSIWQKHQHAPLSVSCWCHQCQSLLPSGLLKHNLGQSLAANPDLHTKGWDRFIREICSTSPPGLPTCLHLMALVAENGVDISDINSGGHSASGILHQQDLQIRGIFLHWTKVLNKSVQCTLYNIHTQYCNKVHEHYR